MTTAIKVPDIGDFAEVEVIELGVAVGDTVELDQTLITLETDKATMDLPSPVAGVVERLVVAVGDKVSEGALVAELSESDTSPTERSAAEETPESTPAVKPTAPVTVGAALTADVVVLGAGPGGYTAAFRAADLGLDTVLVERYPTLGGVCLNVGCIPSKALLHTADLINQVTAMSKHGVRYGEPDIDLQALSGWKNSVVARLTKGLAGLAKQRNIRVVHGHGQFSSPTTLDVDGDAGTTRIAFDKAIIAAGSQATEIPSFPNDDSRLMDSTDALALDNVPDRMLIVGGGIIGLEMAAVYAALGSRVSVVELLDGLMPGCDRDLIRPLQKHISSRYENIFLGTRVESIEATDAGLAVEFDAGKAPEQDVYDAVLVAVGRRPNGLRIGAERAGVAVTEAGFIEVDEQQRTNVAHIFAIGDIVGQPMLAHKATHEGKVAAEVAAGHKSAFLASTIPSVAYTDPEVAWIGVTEEQARAEGIEYEKGVFPWAASGRALGLDRPEGLTKLLFDKVTGRLLGAGIVGPHAGDLIAEATVALELGADAGDLSLSIHPHPTLSETINFAAEIVEGTITDLYMPKK